jgi:predicted signal transduction protein with EAL and GGDEF domain
MADIALYCAKAEGRGEYRFAEPKWKVRLRDRQSLKADLAVCLANGELRLVFQPVIAMSTNKVVAFEALLRWIIQSGAS